MKQSAFEVSFFQLFSPQLNVMSYSINVEVPLYIRLKLLTAHPHMISAWR